MSMMTGFTDYSDSSSFLSLTQSDSQGLGKPADLLGGGLPPFRTKTPIIDNAS